MSQRERDTPGVGWAFWTATGDGPKRPSSGTSTGCVANLPTTATPRPPALRARGRPSPLPRPRSRPGLRGARRRGLSRRRPGRSAAGPLPRGCGSEAGAATLSSRRPGRRCFGERVRMGDSIRGRLRGRGGEALLSRPIGSAQGRVDGLLLSGRDGRVARGPAGAGADRGPSTQTGTASPSRTRRGNGVPGHGLPRMRSQRAAARLCLGFHGRPLNPPFPKP
jgi:hypothetical protein